MSVYQFNPKMLPDSAFEPGELRHVAVGRAGRLLDPRRTPVTIVKVRPDVGTFIVRLDDFEDKGATWEVELEKVDRYQFDPAGPDASNQTIETLRKSIERFDRSCTASCDPNAVDETNGRIADTKENARGWLSANSTFLQAGAALPKPSTRLGDSRLADDLDAFMDSLDLAQLEYDFAEQYVRNPYAGEIVKGHRIVIAELGLVPYEGKVVRDPATFDGAWTKDRRAEHIIARLGFMRALFNLLGKDFVTLHRGFATDKGVQLPSNDTFISASFDRVVAEAHFNAKNDYPHRALFTQRVPIERLFMTYHETAVMNQHYREAEAVLLWEEGNAAF